MRRSLASNPALANFFVAKSVFFKCSERPKQSRNFFHRSLKIQSKLAFTNTIKVQLKSCFLRPSRHSDKLVAVSQNVFAVSKVKSFKSPGQAHGKCHRAKVKSN